jgi:hypothetical protein
MKKICILITLILSSAISFQLVHADRGMIPISPGVSVYEPGQKAIIAWNGREEILILSTDVSSTQETLVLEILPLPSEPVVEAAAFQSFEEIQSMIWEEGVNLFMYSNKGEARLGSVEVLFHEEIGAHNITVVKASVVSELIDWAEGFLAASGLNGEISLGAFESVVENYMRRGFRYYALDLINFTKNERSVDPLLYRFDSSFLYYPLLITSPVAGNTEITLFLITEDKVGKDYWPMQKAMYRVYGGASQTIEFVLSKGDLSKIDLRIGELFADGAWLTVLRYKGGLDLLTRDLMISGDALTSDISVEVTVPTTLIILCFLLGAASTLGGVIATFLIIRSKKTEID